MDISSAGDPLDIQLNLSTCTWQAGSLKGFLRVTEEERS